MDNTPKAAAIIVLAALALLGLIRFTLGPVSVN